MLANKMFIVVGATSMAFAFALGPGGTRAGGVPTKAKAVPRLSVEQAILLCRHPLPGGRSVSVTGFYQSRFNLFAAPREGDLFSTNQVPVEELGGRDVLALHALPIEVAARPGDRTAPVPLGGYWFRMSGTLYCAPHAHPHAGFNVFSWIRVPVRHPPNRPSLSQVLTPEAARSFCAAHPHGEFRTWLVGTFRRTLNLYPNSGHLGDVATSSSAARLPPQMPQDRQVRAYGLLACDLSPPIFEVYAWHKVQ